MQIATILDQIDLGAMALPEFQRGYVWNRDQVRGLMDSLYRKHPVGGLLVWVTKTENVTARGDGKLAEGSVKLLLDGQQRMTSLYGIIRGRAPLFFDGNAQAFNGLHFHVANETFEFYAPLKMKDNPLWVDVTGLMQQGPMHVLIPHMEEPEYKANLQVYGERLNAVAAIKDIDLHIDEVTGEDKTIDVVVDIFNKVNSGGTKLSKGDLALAKICASWPDARTEMKARLDKWSKAGFNFRLEWLLRCITAVTTGKALFSSLDGVSTTAFQQGLLQAEKSIDALLNLISGRLGLDRDDVLRSPYSFPVLARYLVQRNGHLSDYKERAALLYWYIQTFLWGRYAGSTETVLAQDLALLDEPDGTLERLIEQLRRSRGDLSLRPNDFRDWSRSARFYPLLYMLTRVYHAQDWDSGVELSNALLGKLSGLQMHHIFPKALLYKHGYSRPEVNALANFTFLTQETNLLVSDRPPATYLEEFAQKHPGAIESHWIPMDRDLWKVENYQAFLEARRDLLAQAANAFLTGLIEGALPADQIVTTLPDRSSLSPLRTSAPEDEESIILDCIEWLAAQGLPEGEIMYELTDPVTNEALAVFDLAWPAGLQEGLSVPVALLISEDEQTGNTANRAGYRYFTDVEKFREYVRRDILAQGIAAD